MLRAYAKNIMKWVEIMQSKKDTTIFWDNPSEKMQYWFVIRELTGREIKRKYARSKLGIIWSVLNPLLNMIVMSLIFSYMFRRSIEKFPVYYLIGQTLYGLFGEATRSAMTAIVDNKTLILRTKIPKQTFILSRIYTAFVNFLYTLFPLIGILIFFKVKICWKAILIIPDIILLMMFSVGIGYILATMYVFFADIRHLYGIILTILMYMSAIFYPANNLPGFMKVIISYNPIYLAIDIARYVLQYNVYPYYTEWLKLGIYAFGALCIGVSLYKKKENQIMVEI